MIYKQFFVACITIGICYFISRLISRRKRNLVKYGIPVITKVTKVIETNVTTYSGTSIGTDSTSIEGYGVRRQLDIYLDIENAEPARQINIVQSFDPGDYPEVGDKIRVLMDPKDKYNFMISPDQDNIH